VNSIYDHIRRSLPALILLVLLAFLPSCRYLKQKLQLGEYSLKAAIEWAKADSARVADSLKRISLEKPVIKKALPDSVKKVIKAKKVFERTLTDSLLSIDDKNPQQGKTSPRFYIITGSFSNHDNALKEAEKYSSQGFKTTIVSATNSDGVRLELVSVKTFTDHDEATLFLKGFKEKYDRGAWVYAGK
jgi:hypothetical protein